MSSPGHRDRRGHLVGLYGHDLVAEPRVCVLTRIGLQRTRDARKARAMLEHLRPKIEATPGLRRAMILQEDRRTFFILSLWDSESRLLEFGTDATWHIALIRWTFPRTRFEEGKPEIWSTEWKIWSASNLCNWAGSSEWEEFFPRPPQFTTKEEP